jgi:hypothetical protein
MICAYVTKKLSGEKAACGHPARPRRLGMAILVLCVCHHSKLKKQKRYQRKSLRIGRKPLFRAGKGASDTCSEAPAIALKSPNGSETVLPR